MEAFIDLLQTPLFGDLRLKHVLQVAVVLLLVRTAWRFLRPQKSLTAANAAPAACSCGWRGQASRHTPRCPRCGKTAFLQ